MNKNHCVLLALLGLAASGPLQASEVFVTPAGTGSGVSWSDPLGDIQAAVNAAASGDAIRLAGGTYAVSNAIAIGKAVFIRGGYDPATGLPGAAPTVVTRAGAATAGLVSVSGVSSGELCDVTLSGGVLYPAADHAYGAGMRISGSTGYALVNCTVSGNKAQSVRDKNAYGGGVALLNASTASLTDCLILDNEAENVGISGNVACGAGLYVAAGCAAAVTNGVVARNRVVFGQNGQRGAGVYTEGAVSLFNCLVYNNLCHGSPNNVLGDGFCAYNSAASLALEFCTVAYNGTCGLYRQKGAVGASDSILWGNGDDVYGTVIDSFAIRDNELRPNANSSHAFGGGAGFYASGEALVTNCVVKGTVANARHTNCNTEDGLQVGVNGNISVDPRFASGFYLDASSLCRDAGSALADGSPVSGLTTSADGTADGGTVDLGFHYTTGLASDYAAIYVSGVGSDANYGKTAGTPFRTLTKALSVAEDGSAIHVAAGLYDAAAGETFPLAASGISGLNLLGAGSELVLVDAGGGDGALALQSCPNAVIQGMTFKNAVRTTSSGTDGHAYGGGLALLVSGGVVVEDCAFENNKVSSALKGAFGGGVGTSGGTLDVVSCVVVSNKIVSSGWGGRGGGVCFMDTCGGLLRNSLIVGNQLQSHDLANGVYMAKGHDAKGAAALSKIEHCTILDNVYRSRMRAACGQWCARYRLPRAARRRYDDGYPVIRSRPRRRVSWRRPRKGSRSSRTSPGPSWCSSRRARRRRSPVSVRSRRTSRHRNPSGRCRRT